MGKKITDLKGKPVDNVKAIKTRLLAGEKPYAVAADLGLDYMVVYKIAVGKTWKEVHVEGADGRITPPRAMALSADQRDLIWAEKRRTSATNAVLAQQFGVSESSIARGMRDARALLAARVQRLNITSGNNDMAMQMYGLNAEEADVLLETAATQQLSERLARELAEEN